MPFWKKTGKHSKPQSALKRRQKAKPAVPRTAQQSIPMQRMFEVDGVQDFQLVTVFQKCVPALDHDTTFRIGDDIGAVTL